MPHVVTKADLVQVAAKAGNVSKVAAGEVVNAVFDEIVRNVAKGKRVTLVGFGTFLPRTRKARAGRSPVNGKEIKIHAKTIPAFAAGQCETHALVVLRLDRALGLASREVQEEPAVVPALAPRGRSRPVDHVRLERRRLGRLLLQHEVALAAEPLVHADPAVDPLRAVVGHDENGRVVVDFGQQARDLLVEPPVVREHRVLVRVARLVQAVVGIGEAPEPVMDAIGPHLDHEEEIPRPRLEQPLRDLEAARGHRLEILEQTPEVEAIVVPVGGGGLIGGIGTAVKAKKPSVEIVGVEPENAPSLAAAFAHREPVQVAMSPTLADGLAVAQTGAINYPITRRVVDRLVTVDEASIALAILRLIELEKSVVEGAGAAPLAAFVAGKLDHLKGRRVVLVLCGGNIDLTILDRVIETGLVTDGRLARFTVSISDRPGGLARLTSIIASTGASIKEIVHDRAFSGPDLSAVRVVCVVETTGQEHVKRLHEALADAGIRVVA